MQTSQEQLARAYTLNLNSTEFRHIPTSQNPATPPKRRPSPDPANTKPDERESNPG